MMRVLKQRSLPITPVQAGLIALLLALLVFVPGSLKYKLDFLGFGVCHQLSSHSLFIAGHQLPLCARCSGIYLGALVTLIMLLILRPLAGGLPSRRIFPLLGFMFSTMVFDGINSTFDALPGATALYETTNWLRLITGVLAGVSLMFVLYPLFNQSFWRTRLLHRERTIDQPFELFGYLVPAAVVVGVMLSAAGDPRIGDWLYWPLALGSVGGLLALLTMTNVLIVSTMSRRAGSALTWQMALTPLLIALILALIELTVLANLRIALTSVLATSSPPDLPLQPGLR